MSSLKRTSHMVGVVGLCLILLLGPVCAFFSTRVPTIVARPTCHQSAHRRLSAVIFDTARIHSMALHAKEEEEDNDGWGDKDNDDDEKEKDPQESPTAVSTASSPLSSQISPPTKTEPERDLFIPIFTLVSLAGLFGAYGYEMVRLYLNGELYLPF